jgi:hypothetical protein
VCVGASGKTTTKVQRPGSALSGICRNDRFEERNRLQGKQLAWQEMRRRVAGEASTK